MGVDNAFALFYNKIKPNTGNLGSRGVPPAHRAQRAADAAKAAPGAGGEWTREGRANRGDSSPQ